MNLVSCIHSYIIPTTSRSSCEPLHTLVLYQHRLPHPSSSTSCCVTVLRIITLDQRHIRHLVIQTLHLHFEGDNNTGLASASSRSSRLALSNLAPTKVTMAYEKHYSSKKRLYLEPPIPGSKTVRTKITRILPAPAPPPPPPAPVKVLPPPPPPPPPVVIPLPPPPPKEPDTIDVIAVDVDPPKPRRRHRRPRSSASSSSSSSEREVIIERDRYIPVPVRVPEYETFRYVEAPRRPRSLPPPPPPPEPECREVDRVRVVVEDRRRRERGYYH